MNEPKKICSSPLIAPRYFRTFPQDYQNRYARKALDLFGKLMLPNASIKSRAKKRVERIPGFLGFVFRGCGVKILCYGEKAAEIRLVFVLYKLLHSLVAVIMTSRRIERTVHA